MKNKFIHHIAAPIYILFAEKNKEFILEIITSTIPLLWYTTEIITGNIQKNFIYAFISNIIMFIFYVKSTLFNSEIEIIKTKHYEDICGIAMLVLFFEGGFNIWVTGNPHELFKKNTIMIWNITAYATPSIILIIIGYALYKRINLIMQKHNHELSYHLIIQKIKKFPRFAQQHALNYYTRK